MEIETIDIPNPNESEIIIGLGNFTVKTIDELYTLLCSSSGAGIKFGVAMNEAKPRLVRAVGNDQELKRLASETALKIGAGHVFVVYIEGAYPLHVLNGLKHHPCVCSIYAATSNPLQILVAGTNLGRSVIGAVDGTPATAIENEEQKGERKALVKKLGFLPD